MSKRYYRLGFSLIELLIVVAIIAALVGVAVPYFQSNLAEAQQTKARQDLDTIRNAINLYESRFRPLTGADIKQILGQTMDSIPDDPWGGSYNLDASLGILWTYGQDGQPGGEAADSDIVFKYKPELQIRSVAYEGSFGVPNKGKNKMIITMTKPFTLNGSLDPGTHMRLIPDVSNKTVSLPLSSTPYNGSTTQPTGGVGATWTYSTSESKPDDGIVVLTVEAVEDDFQKRAPMTSNAAVDFTTAAADAKVLVVEPHANSIIRNFGTGSRGEIWPGYPDGYQETNVIPAQNGLGARLERKR